MAAINFIPNGPGEYTYSAAGAIAINTVLFDVDAGSLPADEGLVLHVASLGTSGAITIQGSMFDGTDFVPLWSESSTIGASASAGTITAAGVYLLPRLTRYVRVTLTTAATAGNTRLKLFTCPAAERRSIAHTGHLVVSGWAAHDAPVSGSPLRNAARAVTSNYTAVASNDTADLVSTVVGALVSRPFSIPEADWFYAAAAGGIINTTDVAVKASAGAGLRNYITGIDVINRSATATEFVIKDGATVVWRTSLPASMTIPLEVTFMSPIRGTAATAVNIACITTGAQVYANLQGFAAP